MLLLGAGRYAQAWPLYESRRRTSSPNIPKPNPGYPEWQGEDLRGKRLLVVKEQGLGDQIMMVRFIRDLEQAGATVTFLCDHVLESLFRANGFDAQGADPQASYPRADCWTLMFSVPARIGLTVERLSDGPCLTTTPRPGGGIGVRPRGGPIHRNDRNRSLPNEAAAELLRLGRDLDPIATGARDFLETAEIVAGLDLVITVDTAVAHLAGALGKPMWILLSAIETDWRWLRDRGDSPWCASARLYRQLTPGQWAPDLSRVKADLAGFSADRGTHALQRRSALIRSRAAEPGTSSASPN